MTPFGIRKKLKSLLGLSSSKPARPEVPRFPVTFVLPDGETFEVSAKQGDSLVLASGRGPSPIATGCADCTCGTCQVEILDGIDSLTPQSDAEKKTKAENKVDAAYRLGCQAEVTGPGLRVKIINVFGEEDYTP